MPGSIRQRHDRGPNTFECVRSGAGTTRVVFGITASSFGALGSKPSWRSPISLPNWTVSLRRSRSLRLSGVPRQPSTTLSVGWKANGWEDWSPTTARRYESIWRVHIKDSIGTRTLASLSPYDVEVFFRGF